MLNEYSKKFFRKEIDIFYLSGIIHKVLYLFCRIVQRQRSYV